jgi:hypothetical protein
VLLEPGLSRFREAIWHRADRLGSAPQYAERGFAAVWVTPGSDRESVEDSLDSRPEVESTIPVLIDQYGESGRDEEPEEPAVVAVSNRLFDL